MLTVYGRSNSSNCAKIFWLLDALDVKYKLILTGKGHARTDTPEFLSLNPTGKVPVVVDGDLEIWESNAILRYFACHYGSNEFWPKDPAGRARIGRWMDWASLSLTPPLTRLRKSRAAGNGDADLPAVVAAFEMLNQCLAKTAFIAGNSLSLAISPPRPLYPDGFCLRARKPFCRIWKPMQTSCRATRAIVST